MRLVGFIGLGNMGGALARRIIAANDLCVFDLNAEATAAFAEMGAEALPSPRAVAERCEMVFLCLPTSNEVRAVIFGEDGVLAGMDRGGLIVDMTTGDPTATRDMAASLAGHGLALIDSPVSGGPQGAEAGTIAIMVGAPRDQFERCRPVLESISPNIFHVGDVGAGHSMKLVNNVISATNRAIAFEAVTLAVKNGIDPRTCVEVLQKGSGRSYVSDVAFPNFIFTGKMSQGFTLGLMHKDVTLATKLGQDSAVPMPVAGLVRELYRTAMNEFGGDIDLCELLYYYERVAGVKVAPTNR